MQSDNGVIIKTANERVYIFDRARKAMGVFDEKSGRSITYMKYSVEKFMTRDGGAAAIINSTTLRFMFTPPTLL
jgi:hypothetical protein